MKKRQLVEWATVGMVKNGKLERGRVGRAWSFGKVSIASENEIRRQIFGSVVTAVALGKPSLPFLLFTTLEAHEEHGHKKMERVGFISFSKWKTEGGYEKGKTNAPVSLSDSLFYEDTIVYNIFFDEK